MTYTEQLNFVIQLFKEMNIATHIVNSTSIHLSNTIDLGLRTILYGKENYNEILHNSISLAQENKIYRFYDEHHCYYIFLSLPNSQNEYFFVGPYLLDTPTKEKINNKLKFLDLPTNLSTHLYKY